MTRLVVLCVLDGWGERAERADNAIALAATPNFDRLRASCPNSLLRTDGVDVGLPAGQMGNSEVGHLNLGAGRIVNQEIRRIEAAIEDGSLAGNPDLNRLIAGLNETGGTCHLLGLLSPGGVHSHQDHMAALSRLLGAGGVKVAVHGFLDGRDTPPRSALGFVDRFLADVKGLARVRIATIGGRFHGMDRDQRWERTEAAYDTMVSATGARAATAREAIERAYAANTTDEFVPPTAIGDYAGMKDGDAILCANFRADRVRQCLAALLDPAFAGFARKRVVGFKAALGLVEYSLHLARFMTALFPPQSLDELLGGVIAAAGLKQLRIAETEKYAHVTYFFNGGIEAPFAGEERVLIPSPRVATYDLAPEMSADEVTHKLIAAIANETYGFILVNYANPDMVGHTGMLPAAIKAIEAVDRCLGRLEAAVKQAGGVLLITADHGNAETMTDPETGEPHTAHTLNMVPAILVNAPAGVSTIENGRLADVAPTLLDLMNLPKPAPMTGRSLLAEPARAILRKSRVSA